MYIVPAHTDYQNNSIPFVNADRATFYVGSDEVYAYNVNTLVCLNLSQASELIGLDAAYFSRFLESEHYQMSVSPTSLEPSSYYVVNPGQKGGKPARIVPIKYVTLFWVYQAHALNNPLAIRLMANINNNKLVQDASIALGLIDLSSLPSSKADLYRIAADADERRANQDNFYSDKPIAQSFYERLSGLPPSEQPLLYGFVNVRMLRKEYQMNISDSQARILGTKIKSVCEDYNIFIRKVPSGANLYGNQIIVHVPAILRQLRYA